MAEMEKRFDHKLVEKRIYEMWEKGGYFKPKVDKSKKPFTILLPPPNASGKMHIGNVLMIAIEDLMIRWHRMMGDPTLWVPGTDHAGFETQITYERELKKKGKSRFEFDRETLYRQIWDFVQENKHLIEDQIRAMGASVDWNRYTFTLDPQVVKTVYDTFEKMHKTGLVYRDNYLVNFCPICGTTFADLEIKHLERKDPLYYVKYPLVERKHKEPEFLVVATVRPETIMVDTHLAVNPKDKQKAVWIGRRVKNPLTGKEMEIIGDAYVDPEFGTGIVKITPAHDKNDYEVARRHELPVISMLNTNGKLTNEAGKYAGMRVKAAREVVVKDLEESGFIDKIDENYIHSVAVCYKGGHDIEPMIMPNWFVRVETLKKPALEAVKNGQVKIYPKWREITYFRWMEEMRDWPISRQVVWGIRIPVWYSVDENPNLLVSFLDKSGMVTSGEVGELSKTHSFEEIEKGLQTLIAPKEADPKVSRNKPGERYLQETDTFDTWFSSGQWPLVTLNYPDSEDFKYFYPTSVLETGWEIIRFWVSRMIMFGIYLTGKVPFKNVYLHGLVRALDGRKMSKSLGNIINPDEYMEIYGVDALRMGLIAGTANGKDFAFPRDKVIAYRNFANKIWNITRFILGRMDQYGYKKYDDLPPYSSELKGQLKKEDENILNKLNQTIEQANKSLQSFRFAEAGEALYHFVWDEFASDYLEKAKQRMDDGDKEIPLVVLRYVLLTSLKLLHPFMPFVTEEIWNKIPRKGEHPLIISSWPQSA